MKKLLTLLTPLALLAGLLLHSNSAQAQLPNGSTAPNWSLTDINGNSHTLYTVLDSGYTVFLHFAATWGFPGYNFHQSNALQDLHNNYGPNGTNEVRVFMIEGDASTTLADLQGTGTNTAGNWIAGTPFPIINDASQTGPYSINFWPTIYRICPDYTIYEDGQQSMTTYYANVGLCPPVSATANDAELYEIITPTDNFCGTLNTTPEVVIRNYGSNTLTSADIVTKVNGAIVNIDPWTGSLGQYQTANVTLSPVTGLTGSPQVFEFYTDSPNGQPDDDNSNDTAQVVLTSNQTTATNFTVEIDTDNWPQEITWDVQNSGGTVVANGGPYTGLANQIVTSNFSLTTSDCYTFTVYDSFGDGITAGGYVTLMETSGPDLFTIQGADYTFQASETFELNNSPVQASFNIAGEICGNSNGSITTTVTSGVAPYTYQWNNGATTASLSNISAGSYTVTITDANADFNTYTLSVGNTVSTIFANMSATNASCTGNDGSVTAVPVGGAAPYAYVWSNGTLTNPNTALAPGTYSVTVTDQNGCTGTGSATIGTTSTLTVSYSSTSTACGQTNGSVTASVTSGAPPFTYQWDAATGSQTTATATGLGQGTYSITTTDNNGCTESSTVTVSGQTTLSVTSASTAADCGGNAGTATANVLAGPTPITYQWDAAAGSQTSATATGLMQGTYTCLVTDASGCDTTIIATVTGTPGINIAGTVIDADCGSTNGNINTAITGGLQPYTFQWSNGSTLSSLVSIGAGSYTLTVTDANNCVETQTWTVGGAGSVTVTTTSTPANCGATTGTATAIPALGSAPYTFVWSSGATSQTANNLTAGNYTVTVTDAQGCTETAPVTVAGGPAVVLATLGADDNCGDGNGAATASVTSGTAPYSYQWDGSTGWQTSSIATGLTAGTYNVTVTDASGCVGTNAVTISGSTGVTGNVAIVDANCGSSDGSATANPLVGTPPFTYAWSHGPTTQLVTGLASGTYTVTMTDANGCTLIETAVVGATGGITAATSTTDAACGGSNGSATVTPSGGQAPYTYQWDGATGNQTGATATGLSVGAYAVTVTDATSCSEVATVQVNDVGNVNATIGITDESCGQGNGSAAANVTSGTAPYTYQWDAATGSQTSPVASGLSAGTYSVTITDANGCSYAETITLVGTPALIVNTTATAASCGAANGAGSVVPTQGVSPFSYQWDAAAGNATTQTVTGLTAGSYEVTITDGNACLVIETVNVSNANGPDVMPALTDVSCYGQSDGAADLVINGGTMPYSYGWSNGSTTEDITGVAAGTYTVTVTDAASCISIETVVIAEPDSIAITGTVVNTTTGNSDGAVSVNVSGGTSPYSYIWSNGNTTASNTGLAAGSYSVAVSDANGCSNSAVFVIDDANAIGYLATTPIRLYPNPARAGITTLQANWSTPATATLRSVDGRVLQQHRIAAGVNQLNLDVTGYAAGMYFIQLESGGHQSTLKLIVQ